MAAKFLDNFEMACPDPVRSWVHLLAVLLPLLLLLQLWKWALGKENGSWTHPPLQSRMYTGFGQVSQPVSWRSRGCMLAPG